MMSYTDRAANSPTLKRSFSAVADTYPPCPSDRPPEPTRLKVSTLPSPLRAEGRMPFALKRRFSSTKKVNGSVMVTSQTIQSPLPSFMSVFDVDSKMTGMTEDEDMGVQTQLKAPPYPHRTVPVIAPEHHFESSHQHHDSTSTSASASADSSPTTTISTVDSSSITDTSPSSSPESPISILPLSSFTSRRCGVSSSEDLSMCPPVSPTGYNRPLSPGRKARNTKNLSLNMAVPTRGAPPPPALQIKTSSFGEHPIPMTAPSSPSFIVPPKPPKRKPSHLGLTIQLPEVGSLSERGSKGLRIVPPTPSGNRPALLRHHQSSPSLSLFSPSMEVKGGMQLPAFSNQRTAKLFHPPRQQLLPHPLSTDPVEPISEQLSPTKSLPLDQLEEEDIEPPLSQEVKSPAYPSGPVCIYEPNVYLYLEPNDEEAAKFDVVLNVAREVKNPFTVAAERRGLEATAQVTSDVKDLDLLDERISVPDTASTTATFETAMENIQTPTNPSPSTPKAIELPEKQREPEYLHIPWDHNTNIVDDLLRLVELIDERVKQGKRVLVHCQCGVSRSASLIIAYGLYKNPSQSVQDAYDAVKERSRWIGPNMSLIYQLSEFRTLLARKNGLAQTGYRARRTGGGLKGLMTNGRSNTVSSGSPTSRPSLLPDSFSDPQQQPPQTAPLPADRDPLSPISIRDPDTPAQLAGTEKLGDVTPGPSSAPPGLSWIPVGDSEEAHGGSWGTSTKKFGYIPPPLPPDAAYSGHSREIIFQRDAMDTDPYSFPRPPSPTLMSPTLMSPRQAEFMMPFAASRAAEAASSFGFSIGLSNPPTFFADPRSPAQRGEAPIVRSIFDVL